MAFGDVVQSATAFGNAGCTLSFTTTPTEGNLIVLGAAAINPNGATINAPTGFEEDAGTEEGATRGAIAMFAKLATGAESNSYSIAVGGNGTALIGVELEGPWASPPWDVATVGTSGTTTPDTISTGTTAATSAASAVAVAFARQALAATTITSWSNSFIERESFNADWGPADGTAGLATKLLSAVATQETTVTWAASAGPSKANMWVFLAGAATSEDVAIAATLPPLGLSATVDSAADVAVAGSLSALELDASTDSSAGVAVAASLPPLELAAQVDAAAVDVAIAADLPTLELTAQTDASAGVSIAATLPALELSAATTSTADVSVAGSLPALTLAANTSDKAQLSFTGTLQPLELDANLDAAADVTVTATLPTLGLAATVAVDTVTTTFNGTLQPLELDATTDAAADVTVAADLPGLELSAQTLTPGTVTINGTLPALELSAALQVGTAVVLDVEIGPLSTLWGAGGSMQNEPAGVTVSSRWLPGGTDQGWRIGGLTRG